MSRPVLPDRVGIVGLGLIGGSLARSLKEQPGAPEIIASSLDGAALEAAVEEGVVDRAAGDAAVAASGDLVVYAAPLDATLELLGAHRGRWKDRAVLTDVVSLKQPVLDRVRELGVARRWIGGHPMAGSEESGYEASRPDLFRGAPIYLVREEAPEDAGRTVECVWQAVGATTAWIEAGEHDRRMIWASHLPQLLSNALASALSAAGIEPDELGPGGRDMTRLAGSSPELWEGLVRAGGSDEVEGIRAAVRELKKLEELLAGREIDAVTEYMERTRRWREGEGGADRSR